MKTVIPSVDSIERKWYVIDADGEVLGRLASQVATLLRGKHKSEYTPHLDLGDHVIVINADKITVTGNKLDQKTYTSYSGYPGGLKSTVLSKLLKDKPERVILKAVRGMLPKNRLGRQMIRKFRVYTGSEHPHAAQMPVELPTNLRRI